MSQPDSIPSRLAALKTTPTPELKKQWRDLFDSEPPAFNRRYLESRLAYRIQELAYGGLQPATIKRLERLGEELAHRHRPHVPERVPGVPHEHRLALRHAAELRREPPRVPRVPQPRLPPPRERPGVDLLEAHLRIN